MRRFRGWSQYTVGHCHRRKKVINQMILSLPPTLRDPHLRKLRVLAPGWYIEPDNKQAEELVPVVCNFLPQMLIGQRSIIVDQIGQESGIKL